jgi:hypothetical protein
MVLALSDPALADGRMALERVRADWDTVEIWPNADGEVRNDVRVPNCWNRISNCGNGERYRYSAMLRSLTEVIRSIWRWS